MNHGILWILVGGGVMEIMELTSSHAQEGIAKQLRPFYKVEKEPDSDWWQKPIQLIHEPANIRFGL
jgi:hypothetical protein